VQSRGAKSFDAATSTYLCLFCANVKPDSHLRLVCRVCGASREELLGVARRLRSFREADNTWLCRICTGRENTRRARAGLVKKYGLSRTATAAERAEVMRQHMLDVVDEAGGQERVLEIAHRRVREQGGLSDGARRRLSIAKTIAWKRTGEFRLCPGCHKLMYLEPARLKAKALGFHRQCYLSYMQSDLYQTWVERTGPTSSPLRALRLKTTPRRCRHEDRVARNARKISTEICAGSCGMCSKEKAGET
jgi:hypothetical protein